jgi:hypothetical protein
MKYVPFICLLLTSYVDTFSQTSNGIEIESETYFYLNCKNEIKIKYSKEENLTVTVTANNGKIIKQSDELFFAIPQARTMEIFFSVANVQGMEIDFRKINIDVIGVPKPNLVITQNDVEVDYKNGITIEQLAAFEIKIIPDQSFAKYHPEEVRYRVNEFAVYLLRGELELLVIQDEISNMIELSSFKNIAQPGDRLFFLVKDLQRKNFRGQIEKILLEHGNKFNLPIL